MACLIIPFAHFGNVVEFAFQACQPRLGRVVSRVERDNTAIYGHRQGVVMKKYIIIIVLAILQAAWAGTITSEDTDRTMLTFQQIAVEISVQHEALDPATDLAGATAMNTAQAN